MARTKKISLSYTEFDSQGELSEEDQALLSSAVKAAGDAYAPYSGFKVGAAVRLASGKTVTGSNVENAAFPSGICAERNALSSASAHYPGDAPLVIAIAAIKGKALTASPVSPCGNCRQVIAEEEARHGNNIRIILGSRKKIRVISKGGDLLPLQFSREDLQATTH